MFNRRQFGLILLAAPLTAYASKEKAEIWSGEILEKPAKGTIVVAGRHIRLRNRAKPTEIVMLSASNDNQQFTFWVVLPLQHENDYQYVNVGKAWWSSNGTGRDNEGTKTSFQFDRSTALRIADAFGIPIHERKKLDDGLKYTWHIPQKLSPNAQGPIEIVLRIENVGKTTVGIATGGRQRGPRDNRFSYVITRNGKAVKIKDGPDFGGISSYHPIKPGETHEVKCADLEAWADFDLPGFYTIEARYEGELAKDGKMPDGAAEQANIWDLVAVGQGTILVQ